jgi:diacylglycerol kinase (ATP)
MSQINKEERKKFSLAQRAKSFGHAASGIEKFLRSEHNAWLHLIATAAVLLAALVLKVSAMEAVGLTIAVGLVWLAEMVNTAFEKLTDLISTDRDPQIGFIKDVAAGAVLVASGAALLIGLIIFIPKL